jgi:UDP-2,3-diacylglucosamine pyrophosphatase LpxH
MGKKILVIPDLHFPFSHKKKVKKMFEIIKQMDSKSITHVVQLGDLYDCYSQSSFPRDLNLFTPKQEMNRARKEAEAFWLTVQKLCPKAKCFQLVGNHEARLKKSVMKNLANMTHFLDLEHPLSFDNVHTIHDERDELIIDNIIFTHGRSTKPGDTVAYFMQSVVIGHSHRPHLVFLPSNTQAFELNCGYLADPKSPGLAYTASKRFSKWKHAFGIIDEHGPRLITL